MILRNIASLKSWEIVHYCFKKDALNNETKHIRPNFSEDLDSVIYLKVKIRQPLQKRMIH